MNLLLVLDDLHHLLKNFQNGRKLDDRANQVNNYGRMIMQNKDGNDIHNEESGTNRETIKTEFRPGLENRYLRIVSKGDHNTQ